MWWLTGGLLAGFALGCNCRVGRQRVDAQQQGAGGLRSTVAELVERARLVAEQRSQALADLAQAVAPDRASSLSAADRARVLEALGDLHMSTPAVVNALMGNLYWRRDLGPGGRDSTVPPDPWRVAPGLGALLKVGLPAIPPLVEELRTQKDKGKRTQCLFDLNLALGVHARSWLAEALKREQDPLVRSRLEEAARYPFDDCGPYDLYIWFFRGLGTGEAWYTPAR